MLKILQILSYYPIHYFLFPLLGVKVNINSNVSISDKHIVIAANHISRIDPWIIGCSFSRKNFYSLTPIKFMTANVFFKIPVLAQFLKMYGAYPAKKHPNMIYGVGGSNYLLRNGYSVLIFPEGTRNLDGKKLEVKSGVERIKTKSTWIVPVQISRRSKRTFLWTYDVSISEPIKHENIDATKLMNQIYNLD